MKFIGAALLATLLALAAGCGSVPSGRDYQLATSGPGAVPEEFRPYVRTMLRQIDKEWRRGIAQLRLNPPPGSRVIIRFRLGSDGLVARIEDVDESAGKMATYACVNAITIAQPYRRWTKEMILALGHEQEFTVTFLYH